MDIKTIARQDVADQIWNPMQFSSTADRDSYGRAWDYFYPQRFAGDLTIGS